MADPNFNRNCELDILIGSDLFWNLFCTGPNLPILRKTYFGWIIAGNLFINTSSTKPNDTVACLNISQDILSQQLVKFWNIEEMLCNQQKLSSSEENCENYFRETTSRDKSGRFIVKIPFNKKLNKLSNSKDMAITRLKSLERKMSNNPDMKKDYIKFK
ncbi:uncharacterized protein LOC130450662 [Diorhabda sublineata]|uniref:uncharacterized protein LOC130450662 n=1 Tax=Diorhabda sublineata TaxID=1163346 RepID=UPI0024E1010B|nr:uncharacterized protein LOC130450662 [Diorhabda sublineata]